MKHKTGIGVQKRSALVALALGKRSDGKKEVVDFRQVHGESQSAWEAFLNDLYRLGLEGQSLKMIIIDGGKGLLAALPLVYGDVPIQRSWAHNTRNVLNASIRRRLKKISSR